jgi:hypothetical protein
MRSMQGSELKNMHLIMLSGRITLRHLRLVIAAHKSTLVLSLDLDRASLYLP